SALHFGRGEPRDRTNAEVVVDAEEQADRHVDRAHLFEDAKRVDVAERQASVLGADLHAEESAVAEVENHGGRNGAALVDRARIDARGGIATDPRDELP